MNHIDDGAGRFGGLGRTMGTRGVSLFVKRSRRTVRTEEGLGNLCLFMQMDGVIQDIFRPWFTRCPSPGAAPLVDGVMWARTPFMGSADWRSEKLYSWTIRSSRTSVSKRPF